MRRVDVMDKRGIYELGDGVVVVTDRPGAYKQWGNANE
jgi:hypothetical protein